MRKEMSIPAIRDNNLKVILQHYGLVDAIETGQVSCYSCSQPITWDNLGAVLVGPDHLILYCNLSECIEVAAAGEH